MAVTRISTGSEELNRVQDNFLPALNTLLAIPISKGRLIEDELDANKHPIALQITTAFKNVEHKLGRAYLGWMLIKSNANAVVFEDPAAPGAAANPDVTKFLRLKASAAVTVKIWVF